MHKLLVPMSLLIPLLVVGCATTTTPPLQMTLVQPPSPAAWQDSRVFHAAFDETWDAVLMVVGTWFVESANPDTGEIVTMWIESTAQRPLEVSGGDYGYRTTQRREAVRERSQLRLRVTRAGPEHTQVQMAKSLQYFPHWEKHQLAASDPSAWKHGVADPRDVQQILERIQKALARTQQTREKARRPPQEGASAPRTPGWIGVQVQDLTPALAQFVGVSTDQGALVREVTLESPAAQAELQRGDVILEVNKHAIRQADNLSSVMAALTPGERAEVVLLRAQDKRTVTMVVGSRSAPPPPQGADTTPHPPRAWLGATLQNFAPQGAQGSEAVSEDVLTPGVLIAKVVPNGPAAQAGLQQGDLLYAMNQELMQRVQDVETLLGALSPGEMAEVTVLRERQVVTLKIVLGQEGVQTTSSAAKQGEETPAKKSPSKRPRPRPAAPAS